MTALEEITATRKALTLAKWKHDEALRTARLEGYKLREIALADGTTIPQVSEKLARMGLGREEKNRKIMEGE